MIKVSTFISYVFPSVLAFALSGVYTIVDGYFIGNSLGDEGLAAINIAFPVSVFVAAIGTGLGLGGAVRYTIRKEQGEAGEDKEYFAGTVALLLVASAALSLLLFFFMNPIIRMLGADGHLFLLVRQYIHVIAFGAGLQVFATGLVPFMRNLGGATAAMLAMTAGFLTNVLLDYLFIWIYGMGMTGAALATIIGQGVTMLVAFCYLFKKDIGFVKPATSRLAGIFASVLRISLAPFGVTCCPMVTIVLMNRALLKYGGENAVSVFACISYVIAIVYLLLQGIADGSQPLISMSHGKKAVADTKRIIRFASITAVTVAGLCMIGLFLVRDQIGQVFGTSMEVGNEVGTILPLFLGSFIFLALIMVTIALFYSTEESGLSYLLVYSEPILLFILLMLLPRVFGLNGVWIAVPLMQFIVWCISLAAKHSLKLRAVYNLK